MQFTRIEAENEAYFAELLPEDMRQDDSLLKLGLLDGKNVPICALALDAWERMAYLKWVYTDPDKRGKGAASALLEKALSLFADLPFEGMEADFLESDYEIEALFDGIGGKHLQRSYFRPHVCGRNGCFGAGGGKALQGKAPFRRGYAGEIFGVYADAWNKPALSVPYFRGALPDCGRKGRGSKERHAGARRRQIRSGGQLSLWKWERQGYGQPSCQLL